MHQDIALENENWIPDFTQYQFVFNILKSLSGQVKRFLVVIYPKFRGVWFVISLKLKEYKFNKPAFSVKVCSIENIDKLYYEFYQQMLELITI